MKTVLAIALAVLFVLGAAGAWAGEIHGKIQLVIPADRMIVLDDGTKLWLAEDVNMETLREGAEVLASFEDRGGKNVVTSFHVAH
jgi:hypothetical protein